jgi:hypothetical protein
LYSRTSINVVKPVPTLNLRHRWEESALKERLFIIQFDEERHHGTNST